MQAIEKRGKEVYDIGKKFETPFHKIRINC